MQQEVSIGIDEQRWLGMQHPERDDPHILKMEYNPNLGRVRRKVVLVPVCDVLCQREIVVEEGKDDRLELVVYLERVE